jgi:hypothetical protein
MRLQQLKKATKTFTHNSWYPDRGLNQAPFQYKSETLPLEPTFPLTLLSFTS